MKKLIVFFVILFLLLGAYNLFLFSVDETQVAVVIQLGEIIKTAQEPGLYSRIPFIQKVVYLENRILSYDIDPRELYTADKKRLSVDNYAIWKIDDPIKFVQSASGILTKAQTIIDDIVYSNLRNKLASHTFEEIVSAKRAGFLNDITEESRGQLIDSGIYLIDVKIKRADLPESNENAVYQRMSSEREQKARQIRSEGEKEAQIMRAEADKQARIILAHANRTAQQLRGEGDATALQIYNEAYSADPEFYSFWRTLESYTKSLDDETYFILTDQLDYLKFMREIE